MSQTVTKQDTEVAANEVEVRRRLDEEAAALKRKGKEERKFKQKLRRDGLEQQFEDHHWLSKEGGETVSHLNHDGLFQLIAQARETVKFYKDETKDGRRRQQSLNAEVMELKHKLKGKMKEATDLHRRLQQVTKEE